MSLQTSISLLFLAVAIVGSGAVLAVRGLRLWRTIRAFGSSLTGALAALLESAAATEAHAVAVTGRTERLTAAAEHLHESLDRLRVLTGAASEARRSVLGLRALVPKK